jgi:superkiller protein 3
MARRTRTPLWATENPREELDFRKRRPPDRWSLFRRWFVLRITPVLKSINPKLATPVVIFILVTFWVYRVVSKPVAILKVTGVPKSVGEAGYTTLGISERVLDSIDKIDYDIREDSQSSKEQRTFRGADEKDLPEIELPGTKLSVKDLGQLLRTLFGKEPIAITVFLASKGPRVTGTIKVQSPDGYKALRTVDFDEMNLDAGVSQIAQQILMELDPTKLALYFNSLPSLHNRVAEVLGECVARLNEEEKARCLTTWGDIDVNLSHLTGAESKYLEALSWNKNWAPALSGLGSVEAARGNIGDAEKLFKGALTVDHSLRAAHFNLAVLYRDTGRWRLAEREARFSVEKGINGAAGLALLGQLAYQRLDDKTGHARFVEAIAADPDNASTFVTWGNVLLSRGFIDAGVGKFQVAASLRPYSPAIYNAWGSALDTLGRFREAAEQYRHALTLYPEDPGLANNLAWDLDKIGALQEGIAYTRQALGEEPFSWDALVIQGELLFGQGKGSEAIEAWKHASILNPYSPDPESRLGWMCDAIDDEIGAEKHFEAAVRIQPDNVDAHANLGRILEYLGQYERSEAEYSRAMQISPSAAGVLASWGTTLADQGLEGDAINKWKAAIQVNPAAWEPYSEWGDYLFRQGKFRQAAEIHRSAIGRNPSSADLHVALGNDLSGSGELAEAQDEFEKALQLDPHAWNALSAWGTMLAKQGFQRNRRDLLEEAKTKWHLALGLDPLALGAYLALVDALLDRQNYEEAARQIRLAISLSYSSSRCHSDLAWILSRMNDIDRAEKEYDKAMRVNPYAWGPLTDWARLEADQGREPEAKVKWKAAIALSHSASYPFSSWGEYLDTQQRFKEAAAVYAEGTRRNPSNSALRSALAQDLEALGDDAGADRAYDDATRVNPDDWQALSGWAQLKADMGLKDEAIAKWNAAAVINPTVSFPLVQLGNYLSSIQDQEGAIEAYKTALARNPSDRAVRVSLKKAGRRRRANSSAPK